MKSRPITQRLRMDIILRGAYRRARKNMTYLNIIERFGDRLHRGEGRLGLHEFLSSCCAVKRKNAWEFSVLTNKLI